MGRSPGAHASGEDRLDPILARGNGFHIARRTMDNIAHAGLRVEAMEFHLWAGKALALEFPRDEGKFTGVKMEL